ncbi:MAG: hypothetical protein WCG95_04560 [bacterium]
MFITPYSQKNIDRTFPARRGISMAENKKAVSFTSLQDALKYIVEARSNNPIQEYRNYVRLNELDLDKISDICEGLPTFKGWTAKTLQLITSCFDSIMLQIGCIHQCSHCGADSEKKLTTMLWDNFTKLTDDIGIIKERLGYNPFSNSSTDNRIYLFANSDPMIYKSKGKDGVMRNIFDAAQYYYDKTGTKAIITTAGWPYGNKTSQKAAESFVEHPECLDSFHISIHPFHNYMQKSIKYAEAGNPKEAAIWREKYIDMMANVIKSTIGLKDKIKSYKIILQADNKSGNLGIKQENAEYLLSQIFDKLEDQGIDTSHFRTKNCFGLKENQNTEMRLIGHIGRGASYSNKENYKPIYDALYWNVIKQFAKSVAPDGTILVKPFSDPGFIGSNFQKLPFELNFPLPTKNNSERPPLPKLEIRD